MSIKDASKKRPTIRDVAKVADVSVATVSRFLNGKTQKMSNQTAERIRVAIKNELRSQLSKDERWRAIAVELLRFWRLILQIIFQLKSIVAYQVGLKRQDTYRSF